MALTADDLEEFRSILAPDRVLNGDADVLLYGYDAALDRARPEAILLPKTVEDVQGVVKTCARRKLPFVARGAGTNLSGGCIPLRGGVVLSMAGMTRIIGIDTRKRAAVVEPGVVNLRLQRELEPLGFFYAPDPASYRVCTIGGNVAENAGGPRCLKYGTTTNHVLGVEVVLPDGSVERFRADDAGPDLAGLIVGSEGTLGVVTKAWLKILPLPEQIRTILASFSTVEDAIRCVSEIVASGIVPRVLECMDRLTIEAVEAYAKAGLPTTAGAVLLIELDGSDAQVAREFVKVSELLKRRGGFDVRSAKEPAERERLWEARRGAYAAMARIAPNVLVEDGVVPRARLPEALKRIREISEKHGVTTGLLFHAGDGNLHPNIVFDERNQAETKRVKKAGYEMLKACVALGGSISGEHGIGVDKRAAMAWLFPAPTLGLFRRIKKAVDPEGLANPDKVLPLAGDADLARSLLRPAPRPLSTPAEAIITKVKAGGPFIVVGRGTRLPEEFWRSKKKERNPGALSLEALNRLVEVDVGDYHATAEAGIGLSALKAQLAERGYHGAFPAGQGSLGGLIATKAWPEFRDQVLAMRVLLADGTVAELGGKVVKNVAGYDVPKLLFGSWGAFAIILEVTFRIHAEPAGPSKNDRPAPTVFLHPGPWHRRIKSAFDPENRFNPWVFAAEPHG